MKYETLIEDYHGHCFRDRFTAYSDEEALRVAHKYGYNYFANDDCLWRVEGEYVDFSCFNEEQQKLMEKNYKKI